MARDQFIAYQLHRPDLNAGLVLAFRRPECNYLGIAAPLCGLNPASTYTVEFIDEARNKALKTMTGREMIAGLELRLDRKGTSLLVRYKPSQAEPAN